MITLAPHLPEVSSPRLSLPTRTPQVAAPKSQPDHVSKPLRSAERPEHTPSSKGDSPQHLNATLQNSKLPTVSSCALNTNAAEQEPPPQLPFHAAWNHALSQEEVSDVVSSMAKLVASVQEVPGSRLPKNRTNSDAIAVVVPQGPSETPPLSFAVPVPAAAVPASSNKIPGSNPAGSPPVGNESDSEAEAPALSNDPIAFSARLHSSDEAAFEIPTGRSQNLVAEAQAVTPTEQPGITAEVAQTIEQAGAHGDSLPAPAAAPVHLSPAHLVQPIETPAVAPPLAPPVKDIALHLGGPQNIEVRVSEQSGEIRVDVRTADQSLAQDLRGGLHELVSKLDSKGFTAAVSAPSESTVLAARTGDSGSLQDQSSREQRDGTQQDEQQKQRQNQNQEAWSRRNQDSWFNTLSTNIEELP